MPNEESKSTLKEEKAKDTEVLEKDLLTWTAPVRPFKRRSRDFYVTLITIAAILGIILFFIEGALPVILIASLVFLFYIVSTVEPELTEYKITNLGIKIGNQRTSWNLMSRFWFLTKMGSEILAIETFSFPGRLEIVINPELKEQIAKFVSRYLLHEEVSPSFIDKASGWLAQRMPEESK